MSPADCFLASNGYLVVQMSVVSHCVAPGANREYTRCPASTEQRAYCTAVGLADPLACAAYTPMWFNRPTDASETLTQLSRLLSSIDGAAQTSSLGLASRADVTRVVMSGHSAGTAPTTMLAGARAPNWQRSQRRSRTPGVQHRPDLCGAAPVGP